jgi:hypothetical protein
MISVPPAHARYTWQIPSAGWEFGAESGSAVSALVAQALARLQPGTPR